MRHHYFYCIFEFELIPIKSDFLKNSKVTQKLGKSPCTIVHGFRPNFAKTE